MKLGVKFLCIVAAFVCSLQLGFAQPSDSLRSFSYRNPYAAGILEWVIPTLGYAYAGRWSKGLLPTAIRIGGIVLYTGIDHGEGSEWYRDYKTPLIVATVGTVWAVTGAANTARKRNLKLRKAIETTNITFDEKLNPTICYSISF